MAELTGREEVGRPLVVAVERDVEARGNHAALVDAAVEVHHNLAAAVVVHDLELANVAVLLHDLQELHDDARGRAQEHLALAALLGVGHGLEAVGEDGDADHG